MCAFRRDFRVFAIWHRYVRVSILLLITFTPLSTTNTVCPAINITGCKCNRAFGASDIQCGQLGSIYQMPPFLPSSNTYTKLTFVSKTSTIANIQASAFAGISVRQLVLSQLSIQTVSVDAFVGISVTTLESLQLANNGISFLAPGTFRNLTGLILLDLSNNLLVAIDQNLFRGLTSLVNLYLFNNFINSLPNDTVFDDLGSQLTQLQLNGNQLVRLAGGTLSKLTKLQTLSLQDNRLSQIDIVAFASLKSLQMLNLENNDLGGVTISLNWTMFSGLTQLKTLDLSNNNILQIAVDAFSSLRSITSFRMPYNQLRRLPVGVFNNATLLTTLDLSNNRLSAIPDGAFRGLTSLTQLNLHRNDIRVITDNTFVGMPALQTLFISNNGLEAVPPNALDPLGALQNFHATGNVLRYLDAGTFNGCTFLQVIHLHDNTIYTLPSGVFDDLPALRELRLDGNRLPSLGAETFRNLSSLTYLSLTSNKIATVDNLSFVNVGNLLTLALDGNLLVEIPTAVLSRLPKLTTVYLNRNALTVVPAAAFGGLANLNRLLLSNNLISQLDSGAFTGGLVKLNYLDLGTNRITTLPSGLFDSRFLPMLSSVNLSTNLLSSDSLCGRPFETFGLSLTVLDLSANQIASLPSDLFSGLKALTLLILDLNRITSLNSSVTGLKSLTSLSLKNNAMTSAALLDVNNLPALNNLALDRNAIVTLPDGTFDRCPLLTALSLRNNRVTTINANVATTVPMITNLDLGYNSLSAASIANLSSLFPQLISIRLDGNELGASIYPSTFVGGELSVADVDLSNNGLTSDGLFPALVYLTRVTTLTLDVNNISWLPPFASVAGTLAASVQRLSLRYNLLNSSSIGVLANFTQLLSLDLSGNRIAGRFQPRFFSQMLSLTRLSVDNNTIERLNNNTFDGVDRNLDYLSLANNLISFVDVGTFSFIQNIRTLDLSGNRITSLTLPASMPRLNVLTLANNSLVQFPSGLRSFPLLVQLDVSGNQLTRLPTLVVYSVNSISLIDISRNQLSDINGMSYVGFIDRIDLSRNNLTDITSNVFNLTTKITVLDFSFNRFQRVPDAVTLADDLITEMRFEYNRISRLDTWIDSTSFRTNVERLRLRGNLIAELSPVMMDAVRTSLVQLDVRDNMLATIDESLFVNATYLAELYLAGNPWNCDCRLAWIRVFESMQSIEVDSATCVTPNSAKGFSIDCYNVTDCPYNSTTSYGLAAVADIANCSVTSSSSSPLSSWQSTVSSPATSAASTVGLPSPTRVQSNSTSATAASVSTAVAATSSSSSSSTAATISSTAPTTSKPVNSQSTTTVRRSSVDSTQGTTLLSATTGSSVVIQVNASTTSKSLPTVTASTAPTSEILPSTSTTSTLSITSTKNIVPGSSTIPASPLTSDGVPIVPSLTTSGTSSSSSSAGVVSQLDSTTTISGAAVSQGSPGDGGPGYSVVGLAVGVSVAALVILVVLGVGLYYAKRKHLRKNVAVSYDAVTETTTSYSTI